MKTINATVALFLGFTFTTAGALEVDTHAAITKAAYERSDLTDGAYLNRLGIEATGDQDNAFPGTKGVYFDLWGNGSNATARPRNVNPQYEDTRIRALGVGGFSVKGWMMRGSIREDDFPDGDIPEDPHNPDLYRVFRHFFDPTDHHGLLGLFLDNPSWALGSPNAFANPNDWDDRRDNHFTVFDAREAMYRALTDDNEDDRAKYWATTFRVLGNLLHNIQDMAQPQHTRNEAHSGHFPVIVAGEKSIYEDYINARVIGTGSYPITGGAPRPLDPLSFGAYPIPDFDTYSHFWSTSPVGDNTVMDGQGMADYSNRGFFTFAKNFGNSDYQSPPSDRGRYVDVLIDISGKYPFAAPADLKFLKGDVSDTLSGRTINDRALLTTLSLVTYMDNNKHLGWTLNAYNYDDMADLLIPRAVAYSAGLIDYFFRGRLEGRIEATDQLVIKNNSDEDMNGSFELWYDHVQGDRRLAFTTDVVSLGAQDESSAFKVTTPESSEMREPGHYILVFRGSLGNERDAVAGTTVEGPVGVDGWSFLWVSEPIEAPYYYLYYYCYYCSSGYAITVRRTVAKDVPGGGINQSFTTYLGTSPVPPQSPPCTGGSVIFPFTDPLYDGRDPFYEGRVFFTGYEGPITFSWGGDPFRKIPAWSVTIP